MIEVLNEALANGQGALPIGLQLTEGGASETVLIAVDGVGIATDDGGGVRCFPWASIKRLRLI